METALNSQKKIQKEELEIKPNLSRKIME